MMSFSKVWEATAVQVSLKKKFGIVFCCKEEQRNDCLAEWVGAREVILVFLLKMGDGYRSDCSELKSIWHKKNKGKENQWLFQKAWSKGMVWKKVLAKGLLRVEEMLASCLLKVVLEFWTCVCAQQGLRWSGRHVEVWLLRRQKGVRHRRTAQPWTNCV